MCDGIDEFCDLLSTVAEERPDAIVDAVEQSIEESPDLAERLRDALPKDEALVEAEARAERAKKKADALAAHIRKIWDELDDREKRLRAGARRDESIEEKVIELQERELEKGAHLLRENAYKVDFPEDRLQTIAKEDGRYYNRLEGTDGDPLSPGGQITLAAEDLLPIQQLAHVDDSVLANERRPVKIAAKVWRDRESASPDLWNKGSMEVKQYLDAGDLARWIRYRNDDVDANYAKTLASRVIETIMDFSRNRLYTKLLKRSSNGLNYRETRLVLPADSEIPGETPSPSSGTSPGTGEVTG